MAIAAMKIRAVPSTMTRIKTPITRVISKFLFYFIFLDILLLSFLPIKSFPSSLSVKGIRRAGLSSFFGEDRQESCDVAYYGFPTSFGGSYRSIRSRLP